MDNTVCKQEDVCYNRTENENKNCGASDDVYQIMQMVAELSPISRRKLLEKIRSGKFCTNQKNS